MTRGKPAAGPAAEPAVGQGPLEYLTRRRVGLAARQLREGNATLSVVARSVGYGSGSAHGVAFKRVMGVGPGGYRRRSARQTSRTGASSS
ncbi:AraC family transcriptional regulator [Streptomyces werraensis]